MKKTGLLICMAALTLFTSCASQKKKDQTISLSGAFALYPLAVKWSEEYKKVNPEVRFNISGGGAGKGMADALAGAVDLGMFSREIAQEEKDQGVWWVGLTIDAVVPTISDQNPFLETIKKQGLKKEDFTRIFIENKTPDWGNLLRIPSIEKIMVYTRSDACGAAETWAKYLGGKQENLLGIGIYGDPGLAEAVAKDRLGIGFNNTIYAYDIVTGKKRPGMEVIPIDINGNGTIDYEEDFYESFDGVLKAIADGIYPSPPARELYFVSKGKPVKKATHDFLRWCLTEGQRFVMEAGYVPIDQAKIEEYLEKIR
ncbi:MAG: substrate-binding domain-containing protein [Lentimicrobium sp.]|nr:substrate-binding domain-containing protein [Lentimicrobium sp.]